MFITFFDGIILAIILMSALLAMMRGIVAEILSIVPWIISGIITYYLHPHLAPYMQQILPVNTETDIIVRAATIVALYFVLLIIIMLLFNRISRQVAMSRFGTMDQIAGFFFGALRGLLFIVICFIFLRLIMPASLQSEWIADSRSIPILSNLGDRLISLLPDNLNAFFDEILSHDQNS